MYLCNPTVIEYAIRGDRQMDLTQEAQDGYEGGSSPFMLSSPSDMAWRAGGWCYHNLMGQPIAARTGRGYKIRLQTRKGEFLLDFAKDSKVPQPVGVIHSDD